MNIIGHRQFSIERIQKKKKYPKNLLTDVTCTLSLFNCRSESTTQFQIEELKQNLLLFLELLVNGVRSFVTLTSFVCSLAAAQFVSSLEKKYRWNRLLVDDGCDWEPSETSPRQVQSNHSKNLILLFRMSYYFALYLRSFYTFYRGWQTRWCCCFDHYYVLWALI